ncbi:MAG TPA: hypothetical protein DIW34_08495 [Oribacterium sp.]|nr:hypothetical protein [Oribacterium sp.]
MQCNEENPIVLMNFSHIYEDEKFYKTAQAADEAAVTPHILDFTTLSGTHGYCDEAAAAEIRRRIAGYPAQGLHFLDNGNYHYITRFWCEKITEDFVLVVYDHHVDLRKPAFPGIMSCGSWIRDIMLRNTHCRGVLLIGPSRAQAGIINAELMTLSSEVILPEETCGKARAGEQPKTEEVRTGERPKVQGVYENAPDRKVSSTRSSEAPRMAACSGCSQQATCDYAREVAQNTDHHTRVKEYVKSQPDLQDPLLNVSLYCFTEEDILSGRADSHIPPLLERERLPIYISVDKDVLSTKVLHTNWDQGVMTEAELLRELRFFMMSPEIHVLGMDVCGEPDYNAYRRILDDTRNLRRSDRVNRDLLTLYQEHPDAAFFRLDLRRSYRVQ